MQFQTKVLLSIAMMLMSQHSMTHVNAAPMNPFTSVGKVAGNAADNLGGAGIAAGRLTSVPKSSLNAAGSTMDSALSGTIRQSSGLVTSESIPPVSGMVSPFQSGSSAGRRPGLILQQSVGPSFGEAPKVPSQELHESAFAAQITTGKSTDLPDSAFISPFASQMADNAGIKLDAPKLAEPIMGGGLKEVPSILPPKQDTTSSGLVTYASLTDAAAIPVSNKLPGGLQEEPTVFVPPAVGKQDDAPSGLVTYASLTGELDDAATRAGTQIAKAQIDTKALPENELKFYSKIDGSVKNKDTAANLLPEISAMESISAATMKKLLTAQWSGSAATSKFNALTLGSKKVLSPDTELFQMVNKQKLIVGAQMKTNPNAKQGFTVLEEVQQNLLKTIETRGLTSQVPKDFVDSVPSTMNNYRVFVSRNKSNLYVRWALSNTRTRLSSGVFIDLLDKCGSDAKTWSALKRLTPTGKAEAEKLKAAANLPANAAKKHLFDEAIKIANK